MKASELRSKSVAELKEQLLTLLREQFALRMQVASQQVTNTNEVRRIRRDVARVRTLLREKVA